jgi:hypothetical protein
MDKGKKWEFAYEPTTVDEMILHPDVRIRLIKALKEIPNIMLIGSPGIGKGTWVNILRKQTGFNCRKLNGSDERGIDVFREKIKPFCSVPPLEGRYNIMYLNECLEEHEKVRIGDVNKWESIELRDLKNDTEYPIVSFNMKTGQLENDTCTIITDKIDDIYELELEDGRKIKTTKNHPFLVKNNDGEIVEKELQYLSENDEIITL